MPQLTDPNFHRTVVLLLDNNEQGSFGIVLNRPTDVAAVEICASLDISWRGEPRFGVGSGGPVQRNSGWVLLGDAEAALESELRGIVEGVHFTSSIDVLRHVASSPPRDLRLFLGYAGWGPGQLEAELAQGAWLLGSATAEAVFDLPSEEMWNRVLWDMGINPATLVVVPGVH